MDQSPAPVFMNQVDALDPMPQPPEPPDINACCGNGCDPCIFDLHDLAMADYRVALKSWQARQALPTDQGTLPPSAATQTP